LGATDLAARLAITPALDQGLRKLEQIRFPHSNAVSVVLRRASATRTNPYRDTWKNPRMTPPDALMSDGESTPAMLQLLRDARVVSPTERADAVRALLTSFPALRQADLAALLGLSRQLLAPVLAELLAADQITAQRVASGESHRPAQWYTRAGAPPLSTPDLPRIAAAVARLLSALDKQEVGETPQER
jgi:hypothetical protein